MEKTKHYREIWEEANGPIPKGMHIHHILPRYLGGTDDLNNLEMVTPEEHYDIHLERGEYGACALLSDGIDREAPSIPVIQFDLDGYKIQIFDTMNDAGEWVVDNTDLNMIGNYASLKIKNCCDYEQKSAAGYQWFYKSEVGDIDYIGPVKRKGRAGGWNTSRHYYINKDSLGVFNSVRSAIMDMGVSKDKISGFIQKGEEFQSKYEKITKEEYYYLQELKQL